MMLAAGLLFAIAAQADAPPPVAPQRRKRVGASAAPQPTVESRTEPQLDIACRVVDRNDKWSQVSLRATGGRGYVYYDYIRSTPRNVAVVSDPDKVLRDLPFWKQGSSAILFGMKEGPTITFWEGLSTEPYRYVVINYRPALFGKLDHDASRVGFCDVTKTPQLPLSETETKALLIQ